MFNWKITSINAKDGLITEAKYFVVCKNDDFSVETEGFWKFGNPVAQINFEEVTEEKVIEWIKNESTQHGKNIIESRLLEQLDALKMPKVIPPWIPQIFTPNI